MRFFMITWSLILMTSSVWGLAIGDKLTVRVLKTSDTKKTVLVNRGIEDGLEKDEQALFYLTKGAVARGVLVEASPTRSVWSLYRISDSTEIYKDSVMNIKMVEPMKLTEDSTKDPVITYKEAPTDRELLNIPLDEGADDLVVSSKKSRNELDDLETLDQKSEQRMERRTPVAQKNTRMPKTRGGGGKNLAEGSIGQIELWGILQLSALSSSASNDGNTGPFDGKISNTDFMLGGEYYLKDRNAWYDKFSFYGFLRMFAQKTQSSAGHMSSFNSTEYGLGFNYHFLNHPTASHKFIPFPGLSYGLGKSSETYEPPTGVSVERDGGSVASISIGGGVKYYFFQGLGLKFLLDYYKANHKFEEDSAGILWEKDLSGFRMYMGLAYRF